MVASKKKSNAGRKSKYETHVQPRLDTIKAWCRKGLIDKQIAQNLKISIDRFYAYKKKYSEFSDCLKSGLEDAVSQVENAHFKSALGYEFDETKIVYDVDKDGKASKVLKIEKTKKHVQPNVTAQIHYLKNRAPKEWHDRKEIELPEDTTFNVRLVDE